MEENKSKLVAKSLGEVSANLHSLILQLEEQEGEFTPEQEDALAIAEEELEVKLKAYRYRIKENEGVKKVLVDESKRIQSRGKSLMNFNDRLKQRMLEAVLAFGNDTDSFTKRLKYNDVTFFTVNKDTLDGDITFYADCITRLVEQMFEYPDNYKDIDELVAALDTIIISKENALQEIDGNYTKDNVDKLSGTQLLRLLNLMKVTMIITFNVTEFVNSTHVRGLLTDNYPYSLSCGNTNDELLQYLQLPSSLEDNGTKAIIPHLQVVNKPFISSR